MADPDSNATAISTKAGTVVYAVGTTTDKKTRIKHGDYFVDVYNRNFTTREQQQIGNVIYFVKSRHHENECRKQHFDAAATYYDDRKSTRDYNPHHDRIGIVYLMPHCRKSEGTITHELIHVRKYMQGRPGTKHNERKIDFETVGRVSRSGLKNKQQNGQYYSRSAYKYPPKDRKVPMSKVAGRIHQGILQDRRLLTGSVNRSIKGEPAVHRANTLFPQSFFFKRDAFR